MPKPLYPAEVMLDMLVAGKVQKEIAFELGVGLRCVDHRLRKHVQQSGCRSLYEAVALHARNVAPQKPPDGVD